MTGNPGKLDPLLNAARKSYEENNDGSVSSPSRVLIYVTHCSVLERSFKKVKPIQTILASWAYTKRYSAFI